MIVTKHNIKYTDTNNTPIIEAVQGDTGRTLLFVLGDYRLTEGTTARYYIMKPSGESVYNDATIEVATNTITVELTAQSLAEVGDSHLQVRLTKSGQVITSFEAVLRVVAFRGIGAVESTTESNIFDQQVEEAFDEIDTHKADALEEIDTEIDTHVADGKFPNMAAGDIISDLYDENKTPYFFRPSGGGAEVGTIEAPVLVGGGVGWNQLVADTGSSLSVTVTSGHKYVMKKSGTLSVGSSSGSALTGLTGGTDMVTDLTLLLGSTIADRLYTMEQSTAGSGIAQLKAWGFDFGTYIPYCAPTLKHVEGVSAHVMRDADDNIIGNYPLDATLTLRGVPKLDANNQLYYDGDTYEPDGAVTRRYGVVDLGTLNWSKATTPYNVTRYFSTNLSTLIKGTATNNDIANIVCAMFIAASANEGYAGNKTGCITVDQNGTLSVYPTTTYTDVATFKTAMSGIYLLYELATETTETATPFAEYQEVDASGTEEYVSTGVVPVGHVTKYPTDLKGTLESILSAIPSGNGTYALKVTVANGKKTFSWV